MKVGIIGRSIEGLPAQCLDAAGEVTRWHVCYLNRERVGGLKNPIIRKLAVLLELLWALVRMPFVNVVLIIYVNWFSRWYLAAAKAFGKKCILYWLGSDVRNLVQGEFTGRGLHRADLQLSYSEGNIEELKSQGITASLLVLPTRLSAGVAKMPEHHAALLSLPDSRKEFYGYLDLMRLVDDYPNLEFHVVRSEHPEFYDKPNIVFEGMLDRAGMDAVFDRISISIRWPEHDGTSLVLMESALKGKYIITRNPFPCGVETHSYEGLCRALEAIIKLPVEPCEENRTYALEHFTQEQTGCEFARLLDSVMRKTEPLDSKIDLSERA